jgi:GxxExxY protein
MELKANLKCDIYVEDVIVVELKTVENLLPVHTAQVMTYMKLLNSPKGILYNFKTQNLYKEGQRTFVNRLFEGLDDK